MRGWKKGSSEGEAKKREEKLHMREKSRVKEKMWVGVWEDVMIGEKPDNRGRKREGEGERKRERFSLHKYQHTSLFFNVRTEIIYNQ